MIFTCFNQQLFAVDIKLRSGVSIPDNGKNSTATNNSGYDLSEGIGCKCNCRGVCEPEGCQNIFGRILQSRSILCL